MLGLRLRGKGRGEEADSLRVDVTEKSRRGEGCCGTQEIGLPLNL